MDELVRRLRTATEYGEAKRRTMAQAADTIARLRAALEGLVAFVERGEEPSEASLVAARAALREVGRG